MEEKFTEGGSAIACGVTVELCRSLPKLVESSGFSILVILSYCSGTVCRPVSFAQPILIREKIIKNMVKK